MNFRCVAALGLVALGVTGCEQRGASPAGIQVIGQYELTEIMRVDGDKASLVKIDWIAANADRTVSVLQAQDRKLLVYDSAGRLLRSIGGNGSGPGEFRQLRRGGLVGDTLWVDDPRLNRVTLVNPTANIHRIARPPSSVSGHEEDSQDPWLLARPYGLYGGDAWLLLAFPTSEQTLPTPGHENPRLVLVTAAGALEREVLVLPNNQHTNVSRKVPNGVVGMAIPFAHQPFWTVSADGGLVATAEPSERDDYSGQIRLRMKEIGGRSVIDIQYPYEGVAIPQRAVDSVIALLETKQSTSVGLQILLKEVVPLIPRAYPPVTGLIIGSDRRLWFGMQRSNFQQWIAIDSTGAPAGHIALAANQRLAASAAEHIWVIEWDEFDVESLVCYRLSGNPTLADSREESP